MSLKDRGDARVMGLWILNGEVMVRLTAKDLGLRVSWDKEVHGWIGEKVVEGMVDTVT